MRTVKTVTLTMIFLCLLASSALAGYSKDYVPAPAGTTGLLYYMAHSYGNELYADGDKVSRDVNLTTEVQMFRYVKFFETNGVRWDFNCLVPFGTIDLETDTTDDSISQTGDPAAIVTIWPVADDKTRTYFGFSTYVFVPVGEYDRHMPVNIAGNRWVFMEQIGFDKGFGDTKWGISTFADVTVYAKNDEAFNGIDDDAELKQEPRFTADFHVNYDWTKAFYTSVDYIGEFGGETKLDGVKQDNAANDHSVGVTFGFSFNPQCQLLLNYMNKVKAENGVKADSLNLRLGYFF